VLRAAENVARGSSITAAFKQVGVKPLPAYWQKRADDGDDPFWVWMVAVLEIAEAHAVGTIEGSLWQNARDGDTRAQTFFLQRRSDIYKSEDVGPRAGGVSVTINQIVDVLQANPQGIRTITEAGYAQLEEDVEDADFEEVEEAPRLAMTRREPIQVED